MRIPLSSPRRTASATGAVLSLVLLLLDPPACAARPDWVQSVPPEVVLGFQPRTPEEAARLPRPRAALPSLLGQAAPAAPLAANDGPGAVWSPWAPPGLCYHSLVQDSRRGVFYVVGGGQVLDPQGLVWRYEPVQGTCTPIASRPGGAAVGWNLAAPFFDAVYDSLRDRLLVSCRYEGRLTVFALDLTALSWSELWSIPSNGLGNPAGIAIDRRRDLLALLGVWDSDSSAHRTIRIPLADPNAWSVSWTRGAAVPGPGISGCALYDEVRDRYFVLFDQNGDIMFPGMSQAASSLWSLSASGEAEWAPFPHPAEWGAGYARALVRDPVRDRLLLVNEAAELWSASPDDGSAMRLASGNAGPAWARNLRFGIAAAFDPASRRLHVHGGQELGQALPLFMSLAVDEAWPPSVAVPTGAVGWSADAPGGLGSRGSHSLLLDPVANQLVVLGGGTVPFGDTSTTAVRAMSANAGWRHIDPAGQPQGRASFGSGYAIDRARHAVLAFGGQRLDGSGTLDDQLWSLSLEGGGTWRPVETIGPRPRARRFQEFFFDAPNNRFLLSGGDDRLRYLTDIWELRMEPVPAWRELHLGGEPIPPYLAIFPDEWRGDAWGIHWLSRDEVLRPVYKLELRPDSVLISRVPIVGEVPYFERITTGVCYDPMGQRLVGFLRQYDDVYFPDLFEVRLGATATWNLLPTSGVTPWNRGFIATAFDPGGNRMLMVGGYDDNQDYRGDTWQLQLLDYATPVALSLASATADADGVHLRWRTGAAVAVAAVERSRDGAAWEPVGNARERGAGELAFDDATLAAGESAAYRLRLLAGGEVIVSELVWVTAVPGAAATLSLRALARPAGAPPSVLFAAAGGEQARLSLLDVGGRRLEDVRVAGGTRTHTFAQRPAPGLYFAELTQGGERRVARIVVTP